MYTFFIRTILQNNEDENEQKIRKKIEAENFKYAIYFGNSKTF